MNSILPTNYYTIVLSRYPTKIQYRSIGISTAFSNKHVDENHVFIFTIPILQSPVSLLFPDCTRNVA